jgi:S-layer family protein
VEFRVNSYTTGYSELPAVAMAGDGRFVVAWTDNGIQARRYDAQGNAAGPQFAVVPPMANAQGYPAVAMQASGGFLVTWNRNDEDAPGTDAVQARLFDATGAPRGADFRVNQVVTGDQGFPSLCADADGNFFAAWESQGQDGDETGIFARRISARGAPMGAEFQVNTYTSDFQARSTIACDPDGNVVVAWDSFGQDGNGFGVYARRFGRFDPDAMEVDAKSGNGVFEPGETAEVATEWRNFTHQGLPSTAGTASAFTGPPGATYTIADGTANYGPTGAGESTTCELFEDCFAMSVSAPPTRPATHWDARFLETLTIGRTQTWTLHVGASFADVPVASPFYRFIETVLHNGVTGGCGTASYCPAAATSREQMPVMVLVAREGATYAPPSCQAGSERFTDVPASSPFCRWIEELARRGAVGGCAQNTYCPSAPVSREQMAVFVLATLEAPGYVPPACAVPMFGDVPASSPFCRWIEELARRGVVSGCGSGNYCPSAAVTREQVSVFVAAGFGLTLYGP